MNPNDKSIIIIGAGFAGLAAGIYARLNGYNAQIFEMHNLPGLKNFYMCGQWVEPGGGLPTAIMSARRLLKKICKEDHRKFKC